MIPMIATKNFDLGNKTITQGQRFKINNYFATILRNENKAKDFKGNEKEWNSYVSV